MVELEGKVAIVTGAGRMRGIGRASAVALAKRGADIVVTGTGRDPASFPQDEIAAGWNDIESTAERVRALGRRALPLVSDAADGADVDAMVEAALHEFGRIDILVNNAAFRNGPDRVATVELDNAVFQQVMTEKVFSTYRCSKAVIRVLRRQGDGGRIVSLSSAAGKRGTPSTLAYNAANFAVVGMTQSLARELAPDGINVNCVCPGLVDTARMDRFGRGQEWQDRVDTIPLGRAGSADEIGEMIAYLCTPATSFQTAATGDLSSPASAAGSTLGKVRLPGLLPAGRGGVSIEPHPARFGLPSRGNLATPACDGCRDRDHRQPCEVASRSRPSRPHPTDRRPD